MEHPPTGGAAMQTGRAAAFDDDVAGERRSERSSSKRRSRRKSKSRGRRRRKKERSVSSEKDAFGRSVATRQKYGDKSASPERRRRRDRSGSSDGSFGDGGMPLPPGFPAVAAAMWGSQYGMPPFGMGGGGSGGGGGRGDWWKAADGAKGGKGCWGWPGPQNPMAAAAAMWGWPGGMGGRHDGERQNNSRRGRSDRHNSTSRSRDRSRSRSRSQSRGNKSVDSLRLPRSVMGRVIGKQGATIKDIRERSGAVVDAEDRDGDMCEFRLSGRPESVDMARRMILDIAESGKGCGCLKGLNSKGKSDFEGEDVINDTLDFPVTATGCIIGSRGFKIMEVRQLSGARVSVEKAEDRCKVFISGRSDAVERARMMVTALARGEDDNGGNRMPRSGNNDAGAGAGRERSVVAGSGGDGGSGGVEDSSSGDVISDSLEFPQAATGGIIGTRGAKIAEVRERSGAKVQVEKSETCCKVIVTGTADQVERAKAMITSLAEEQTTGVRRHECEDSMVVPLSMVGRVIGKGGETVQRLQVESGAKIDINARDGHDPCPVKIAGTEESVHYARRLINEILERSENARRSGGEIAGGGSRGWEDPAGMWGGPPCGAAMPWASGGGFGGCGDDAQWWNGPAAHGGPWPAWPPCGKGGFPTPWDCPAGDGNSDRIHIEGSDDGGRCGAAKGDHDGRQHGGGNVAWRGATAIRPAGGADIDLDEL